MCHTKIVNRTYTLNSSLDFYFLFENLTTYNYFSSWHNFVMFKNICKWDLLPLKYQNNEKNSNELYIYYSSVNC